MPRIKTVRAKRAPPGFDKLEETLADYESRLKDAQDLPASKEPLHVIFQLHHQRSRYVYDLYYTKKAISTPLYLWLLKNRYADADLIAKWKKQGYENLCCLRCIQASETTHGGTCICRVPRKQMDSEEKKIKCVSCGCRGCASTD